MKYIEHNGHIYGVYATFIDAYFHVMLVENKKKVAELTLKVYTSVPCTSNKAFAFVNMNAIENTAGFLEKLNAIPTGRVKTVAKMSLAEYDFSSVLAQLNRDMRRDKMKDGVIEVSGQVSVSSSLVFYIYKMKRQEVEYHLVTIDGLNFILDEEHFLNAVKNYNVPVFRQRRKEPFKC